jgi:hypothetical protein
MHRVSIIVPSWNCGEYLRDCVLSIRKHAAGVEVEVIVIDDDSTDEASLGVLKELELEPDVVVIRNDKNRGAQFTRNAGLGAATGDYLVCLDGNDVLLPLPGQQESFLTEAAQILATKPEVAFVHTQTMMFGQFSGLSISSYPLREDMVARKHHVPLGIVYRRSEVLNGLDYLETVPEWQDWAFAASLLARRWARKEPSEIGFVGGPGYGCRIHSAGPGISQSAASEPDATRLVVAAYPDYFASKYPHLSATDTDAVTAAVLASKPSPLESLLFMASYSLEQALEITRGRGYQLLPTHDDRL